MLNKKLFLGIFLIVNLLCFSIYAEEKNHISINLPKKIMSLTDRPVTIAIIDTGIDKEHPLIKHNIFFPYGKINKKRFGFNFVGGKETHAPVDNDGHGTHIASIIKSVYPLVKIIPIKYYDPSKTGQENLKASIMALKKAIELNVDIINYSGGGTSPSEEELKLLEEADRRNILIVAAAGNGNSNLDDENYNYYPASYKLKNIISVMGHDNYNLKLSQGNWGPKSVDISAPGYKIKGAIPKNKMAKMTGTSQSTAFVTGVAAIIKSKYPFATPKEIKGIILRSAKREAQLNRLNRTSGKLDATRSIDLAHRELLQKNPFQKFIARDKNLDKSTKRVSKIFTPIKSFVVKVPVTI